MKMDCPKVYTIYLPQFYRTAHNDEWWGDGFTDWVAVKQATSMFEGHRQPRVPKGGDYYNLLDRKVMENQIVTAKKYGIDGFVFYHYYFGNSRMELEKPAENLLKWKNLHIPFCFSWANQSWIRTWSKIAGNIWGDKFEEAGDTGDNGVLVEQIYGDQEEWERHFEYLLPFFKDSRYIRINGCPVFIIYSPDSIGCIRQMIDCWRKLAKTYGLKGLYLIGYNTYNNDSGFDALMMHEPGFSIRKLNKQLKITVQNGVRCIDYDEFWKNTIATMPPKGIKTYFTGACGYDNTPRRGNRGECLINRTPELFRRHLTELLQKSEYFGNEFAVINAWNEWGEGMYLEADEDDGYAYLETVKDAKKAVSEMNWEEVKGIMDIIKGYGDRENEQEFLLGKFKYYYKVCSRWIDLMAKDTIFADYLKENGINTVAIYGFADLGHKLLYQLRKEGISVKYAIDQYVGSVQGDIHVYRPEEELPEVDAVIITAYEPNEIKAVLHNCINCKLYSIRELLDVGM
ncbi:MAG: glycoside hydrolase family 99-like domain-containing protein [Lachnospiraceae bacterium]|nr:glycoside hydrolase family 99-like domain-containing protein [Lachnospiraceae bacterium]